MKLAHVLIFLFPYWVFGDSVINYQRQAQSCICHPAGFPDMNITSDFIPYEFNWKKCQSNDNLYNHPYTLCSGYLSNNSSCQVTYNSTKVLPSWIDKFQVNCNSNTCLTNVDYIFDEWLVCQQPLGCLPLENTGNCKLSEGISYSESYISAFIYYNLTNWEVTWVYCLENGAGEAKLKNKKNNLTALYQITYQSDSLSGLYSCPYDCSHNQTAPCSFEFINDKSCDLKYYVCDNVSFLGCKNGEGAGSCTNPRSNEECQIISQDPEVGILTCPSCSYIEWRLKPIVYPVANNDFSQFSVDSCIEPVKDGSCHLPDSFKCKGVLWDVCVNGVGQGKCTNDMESCDIIMSSNCSVTKSNSCGVISCDSCDAGWHLPDQPVLYDSPLGCMNGPSPFSPDDESFIIPVSIVGGVVFVGVTAVIITVALCFGYNRYKRQGYQQVEGQ